MERIGNREWQAVPHDRSSRRWLRICLAVGLLPPALPALLFVPLGCMPLDPGGEVVHRRLALQLFGVDCLLSLLGVAYALSVWFVLATLFAPLVCAVGFAARTALRERARSGWRFWGGRLCQLFLISCGWSLIFGLWMQYFDVFIWPMGTPLEATALFLAGIAMFALPVFALALLSGLMIRGALVLLPLGRRG